MSNFDAAKIYKEFNKLPKSTLFFFAVDSYFKCYANELSKIIQCDRNEAKLYLAITLGDYPLARVVDDRFYEDGFRETVVEKYALKNEGFEFASQIIQKAHLYQMLLIYKDRLPIEETIETLKIQFPLYLNASIQTASQLAIAKLAISFIVSEGSLNHLLNQIKPKVEIL